MSLSNNVLIYINQVTQGATLVSVPDVDW
jgi:hypothetical protein